MAGGGEVVTELRRIALRGLAAMYRPGTGLFPFRVRRDGRKIVPEGESLRYTAIALIGLSGEEPGAVSKVLAGGTLADACARLAGRVAEGPGPGNGWMALGDASIVFWACCAAGYPDRKGVLERLLRLRPEDGPWPTVEVAWALAALCNEPHSTEGMRDRLARRLVLSQDGRTGVFPHGIDGGSGLRSHVACFADMVYPIYALSLHHALSGDRGALAAAGRGAERICEKQGPDGQWWWHYDRRTGDVVERYPVYAIHQDAMAPMALFALREAGGADYGPSVARGIAWLASSPELGGGSLIDRQADVVWRKVARREPGKLSRYAQAVASRVHPSLRVPGLDSLFPPASIDYEDRPYHPGWLLHAFPRERAERMGGGGVH